MVGDQDYGPILSSLLVGPCALEYTKVKSNSQHWYELPANELVQRHKISSCGSSSSLGSSTPSLASPRLKDTNGTPTDSSSGSKTGQVNLTLSPIHQYKRSLSSSMASSLAIDEKRLVPSQAREYVESLHQNHQKDVLIYGKNYILVQPKDHDSFLPGYLSLHQITSSGDGPDVASIPTTSNLVLKWTPNKLMNGHTTEEKSASWQNAIYIDLNSILFIHCHQVVNDILSFCLCFNGILNRMEMSQEL